MRIPTLPTTAPYVPEKEATPDVKGAGLALIKAAQRVVSTKAPMSSGFHAAVPVAAVKELEDALTALCGVIHPDPRTPLMRRLAGEEEATDGGRFDALEIEDAALPHGGKG